MVWGRRAGRGAARAAGFVGATIAERRSIDARSPPIGGRTSLGSEASYTATCCCVESNVTTFATLPGRFLNSCGRDMTATAA